MNKKNIKTQKDIQSFLIDCGFTRTYSYINGIGHYLRDIEDDDVYIHQIDGWGLRDIESLDAGVVFVENGKDSSVTPMWRYCQDYPNLKAMVEAETKRGIDFSGGLEKWSLK